MLNDTAASSPTRVPRFLARCSERRRLNRCRCGIPMCALLLSVFAFLLIGMVAPDVHGASYFDVHNRLSGVAMSDTDCSSAPLTERAKSFEEGLRNEDVSISQAYQLYMSILTCPTGPLTAEEKQALTPMLYRLRSLMAPSMSQQLGFDESGELQQGSVADTAPTLLHEWWVTHDPAPSTPENERLVTHIQRVRFALAAYRHDPSPTGYDDRGDVYVRYGSPYRQREILFNSMEFLKNVVRPGVGVSRSDFPDNEVWTYPHIHNKARFIFIDEGRDGYREGIVSDLLPQTLRSLDNSPRGENRAFSSIHSMQHIYRQLALVSGHGNDIYGAINKYLDVQAQMQMSAAADHSGMRGKSVGFGSGQQEVYANPATGDFSLASTTSGIMRTSEVTDRELQRRREQEMPADYTQQELAPLPAAIRTTRFLSDEGETKIRIDYAVPSEDTWNLFPDDDQKLQGEEDVVSVEAVSSHGIAFDDEETIADSTVDSHVLSESSESDSRTMVLSPFTPSGMVAFQVDGLAAPSDGGAAPSIVKDSLVARSVHWFRDLRPLSTSAEGLEMSDLVPLELPDGGVPQDVQQATPYPYEKLRASEDIALLFEIYGLRYNQDDQTQWTATYETVAEIQRNWFARRFGENTRTERTSAAFSFSGSSSNSAEFIAIDLSRFRDVSSPTPLTVRVTVTDETRDVSVERTTQFTLIPGDE